MALPELKLMRCGECRGSAGVTKTDGFGGKWWGPCLQCCGSGTVKVLVDAPSTREPEGISKEQEQKQPPPPDDTSIRYSLIEFDPDPGSVEP